MGYLLLRILHGSRLEYALHDMRLRFLLLCERAGQGGGSSKEEKSRLLALLIAVIVDNIFDLPRQTTQKMIR